MIIRNFKKEDRTPVLAMVEEFYHSPGVLNPIPTEFFADVFDEMCDGGSARLRGLAIVENDVPVGFCSLSFSYSTEAGGPVVLIEEVYISSEFQGKGFGSALFDYVIAEYKETTARFRLEVAPENLRAMALYKNIGFDPLPYTQMILEDF